MSPNKIGTMFFCMLLVVSLAVVPSFAGNTKLFYLPVTYYDFHEDGTNPEFEASQFKLTNIDGTIKVKLVLDNLDKDSKPVKNPDIETGSRYLVDNVAKWFRPWVKGEICEYFRVGDTTFGIKDTTEKKPYIYEGETLYYLYKYSYDTIRVPSGNIKSDSCFKNVVIKDSIRFVDVGNGFYALKANESIDDISFFPLDGKGFEVNGRKSRLAHNFSFTMELHNSFIYHGNETFEIKGDDDIWLFIDNKLAINLGGLHPTMENTLTLSKLGLVAGKKYSFDLFFAERHTGGSNLLIKTNIDFGDKRK